VCPTYPTTTHWTGQRTPLPTQFKLNPFNFFLSFLCVKVMCQKRVAEKEPGLPARVFEKRKEPLSSFTSILKLSFTYDTVVFWVGWTFCFVHGICMHICFGLCSDIVLSL